MLYWIHKAGSPEKEWTSVLAEFRGFCFITMDCFQLYCVWFLLRLEIDQWLSSNRAQKRKWELLLGLQETLGKLSELEFLSL